jgi:hypothetical protein
LGRVDAAFRLRCVSNIEAGSALLSDLVIELLQASDRLEKTQPTCSFGSANVNAIRVQIDEPCELRVIGSTEWAGTSRSIWPDPTVVQGSALVSPSLLFALIMIHRGAYTESIPWVAAGRRVRVSTDCRSTHPPSCSPIVLPEGSEGPPAHPSRLLC